MEKRERYDPEDLESLLSERAFDELLAEERAYVLRHVSGRDEYEAMRATLGQLRAHPSGRAPIVADPETRDRVLAAFREAHQPQWRIWLNSISLWLMPERPVLLWRPALALASLVLLVVAGVTWFRGQNGLENAVAEVKLEVPQNPAPMPQAGDRAPTTTAAEPEVERYAAEKTPQTKALLNGVAELHEDRVETLAAPATSTIEAATLDESVSLASAGLVQEMDTEKANEEATRPADVQLAAVGTVSKTLERAESKTRSRKAKDEESGQEDMTITANADLFVLLRAAW
ncbi:MAG: hypothetical protein IPK99_01120 [Flavobacteriales bacterium]|nr:hypothetical protein [Flavobacteriales bacterium]